MKKTRVKSWLWNFHAGLGKPLRPGMWQGNQGLETLRGYQCEVVKVSLVCFGCSKISEVPELFDLCQGRQSTGSGTSLQEWSMLWTTKSEWWSYLSPLTSDIDLTFALLVCGLSLVKYFLTMYHYPFWKGNMYSGPLYVGNKHIVFSLDFIFYLENCFLRTDFEL